MHFPAISPVIVSIGPFAVRWYGLMYLCGFFSGWLLGRSRVGKHAPFTAREFDDILTWGFLGVIIGARLGYVLFYDFSHYLANPLSIVYLHQGGMSFHGGLLGVIFFMWFAARRRGKTFFATMDFMAPLVPPGLFFGRVGNFINGELWGRVTSSPVGMVFPGAGSLPRHPSQLYEAALEGVILFCLLWIFSAKPRPRRAVSGLFLVGYGVFRFCVEFFREPDTHLGFVFLDFFSMGQILCLPMILGGALLLFLAYSRTGSQL
ncbi:prolipoprotein diacylglyceryl transferase [Deltaproteobacteria bacterium]|nr:prolipoprotein diacylglyceryl transferase [Deltaproteobacteria bacterium]